MAKQLSTLNREWRTEASCKGMPIKLFYPERGEPVLQLLRDLCTGCPARESCLNYALHHEKHGFWGGCTEDQRQLLRRKLNIKVQTPESLYLKSEVELNKNLRENAVNKRKKP